MPRRRSTVIHVRPEIRRRVHRRRFFRKVALVVVGAALLAGTVWQYGETIKPQPVPNLPPSKLATIAPSAAPVEPRLTAAVPKPLTVERPISTTPIPVAGLTVAPTPISIPVSRPRFPVPPKTIVPAPAPLPTPSAGPEAPAGRTSIITWFESIFPLMVRTFEERVATILTAAKNRDTIIKYSEREFQQVVVRQLQARSLHQLQDLQVSFHPEGIQGSGVFQLGPLPIPFSFQATIDVVKGRPHAVLQGLNTGGLEIPSALLKALESRVNQAIDQDRLPLEIKWFRVEERQILISAELV